MPRGAFATKERRDLLLSFLVDPAATRGSLVCAETEHPAGDRFRVSERCGAHHFYGDVPVAALVPEGILTGPLSRSVPERGG
jgi:hypothetical protein